MKDNKDMSSNKSKTPKYYLKLVPIIPSNLEHIADTGAINGSLLASLEKAMQAYADQETASLKEQVGELKEGLNEINNIAWEIWHQHCQDDETLDKAENITAKISQLLEVNK